MMPDENSEPIAERLAEIEAMKLTIQAERLAMEIAHRAANQKSGNYRHGANVGSIREIKLPPSMGGRGWQ